MKTSKDRGEKGTVGTIASLGDGMRRTKRGSFVKPVSREGDSG